jgi:hypothetical protein
MIFARPIQYFVTLSVLAPIREAPVVNMPKSGADPYVSPADLRTYRVLDLLSP